MRALASALVAIAAGAALAGCGAASTHAPTSLPAACAKAARETLAVSRRRLRFPAQGPIVSGSPAQAALRRGVQEASREVAAIDRATASAIDELAQTQATRAALVQLARNERALLALPPAEEARAEETLGAVTRVFDFAEAAGGCRQARRAIGG